MLAPRIQARLVRLPAVLSQPLATTLAAQVFVLPIVAQTFQQVSIVSPFANLLAAPLVPGAIEWGALTVFVGSLSEQLAAPFAWLTWLHLALLTKAVEATARVPFGLLEIGGLGGIGFVAYYGLLAVVLAGRGGVPASTAQGLVMPRVGFASRTALGLGALGIVAITLPANDGLLRVTVFDVGQGDAILIQSPAGQRILVDGGPDGSAIGVALGKHLPFWDKGIDLAVLTHGHDDHLAGLLDVLDTYQVRQVLAGQSSAAESATYQRWQESAG